MKFKNNIFSRVKNAWAYRHEPESLYALAYYFWTSALVVAFCCVVLSILYGYSQLKLVDAGLTNVPEVQNSASTLPFSPDDLQAMLDEYATRKVQYDTVVASTSGQTFLDPSK